MISRLVAFLLRLNLSAKSRRILTDAVMHSLNAVPLRAMISVGENQKILIKGRGLEPDQVIALRESASNALNSFALTLVREQVRFAAIDQGFLKSQDPTKDSAFYKAALWYIQEEQELLKALSLDS